MKRTPLVLLTLAIGVLLFYASIHSRQKGPSDPAPSVAQGLPAARPLADNPNQLPPVSAGLTKNSPQLPSPSGSPAATPARAAAGTGFKSALLPNGEKRRLWDSTFFATLDGTSEGNPIHFELAGGEVASGTVRHVERSEAGVIHVSGQLDSPESGRFFFQKQSAPGKAGEYAGVVEFPQSKRAYRIEPSSRGSELVERPLEAVVCLMMPPAPAKTNDTEEIPPLQPSDFPDVPIPPYQKGIIVLESLPGATAVVYLDYRGGRTPTWGGITYSKFNVSNSQIKDVWKRVSEDFMPFNINVTTDIHVYERAPERSRQRVVLTPTTTAAPGAGGVAYIGSFNWTGDTPCWAFYGTGKDAAEVVSHEVGHTLGLLHDGKDFGGLHTEYYDGQGSGSVGWAPIMGVGYYKNVTQWSKGEYAYANNREDDLSIITSANNDVDYRADDTGSDLAHSRYLEIFAGGSAKGEGVIERSGDTDAFQFTTRGGQITLRVEPVGEWADLALRATLRDSSGQQVAADNLATVLHSSITTVLDPGTYTFQVTGAGRNTPFTDGFSDYGSLGYYKISGTIAGARLPDRFTIFENTPAGAEVGRIPANNPSADPLEYVIRSGNDSGTFAINNSGRLTVANASTLDYEKLATRSQFPVQFELFVDIVNTVNASLSELNRRVVVAVTNANEAPSLSNFSGAVLEHSLKGELVTTVQGSDPDFYTLLSYSIIGGDPKAVFSIDAASGEIRVAADISRLVQTNYQILVRASDLAVPTPLMATSVVTIAVLPNENPTRVPAKIGVPPAGGIVLAGTKLELHVAAVGTKPITYKWYHNNILVSSLGPDYVVSSTAYGDRGTYRVAVTNAFGGDEATFEIEVGIPPIIAEQPKDATLKLGTNLTLYARGAGSLPLYYQWFVNGERRPDATNYSLKLNNLQFTNGGTYACVITNAYGAAATRLATLKILARPTIVANPVNQLATNASATPVLTGFSTNELAPKNRSFTLFIDGGEAPLSGAGVIRMTFTTNIFRVIPLTPNVPAATGTFVTKPSALDGVEIELVGLTTNKLAARLILLADGSFLVTQSSKTLQKGHFLIDGLIRPAPAVSFTVQAIGTEPMAYQWYSNGVAFAGKTNRVLTIANPRAKDVGKYFVTVTNALGKTNSAAARLDVLVRPQYFAAQGAYNGIFFSPGKPEQRSSGSLKLTLAANGGYTGKLTFDRTNAAFSGQFSATGQATNVVLVTGFPKITLYLILDPAREQIDGLAMSTGWSAFLRANRTIFGPATPATDFSGNYLLSLTASNLPTVSASMTVSNMGSVLIEGLLPDTTAYRQVIPIARAGEIQVYIPLYDNKGSLFGWLTNSGFSDRAIDGTLFWAKPTNGTAPGRFEAHGDVRP
jgi:hypothetical protein